MATILTPVYVEKSIGDSTAPGLEAEHEGVATDPGLLSYVGKIGQALVAANGRRTDFAHAFKPLNSVKIVNAFAIGDGNVYITKGLLNILQDESELAYILGHEIGHVGRRHLAQGLDIALGGYALLGIATFLLKGTATDAGLTKAQLNTGKAVALSLVTSGYSRSFENEADHDGVAAAAAAGYDPWGAVRVMERFEKLQGAPEDPLSHFFASHPYSSERVAAMTGQITTNYGAGASGKTNATAFNAAMGRGLMGGAMAALGVDESMLRTAALALGGVGALALGGYMGYKVLAG